MSTLTLTFFDAGQLAEQLEYSVHSELTYEFQTWLDKECERVFGPGWEPDSYTLFSSSERVTFPSDEASIATLEHCCEHWSIPAKRA